MAHLVSVIVPIYKVEAYLQQCVDSLLAQTYKNLEIILVDDGSPDRCGEICDAYAAQDPRVKVVHKPNGGLSDARNAGLAVSSGEYVLFIDSDDYVDSAMVARLYDACQENAADIAVCYFDKVTDAQEAADGAAGSDRPELLSGKEVISRIYRGEGSQIAFVAWNKLYRKKLFTENKISYPVGKYYEDEYVTHKLLYFSRKVALVKDALYHYRIRANSIMTTTLDQKRCINNLDAKLEAVRFFHEKQDAPLFQMAFYSFCRSALLLHASMKQMEDKAESQHCKQYLVKTYRQVWHQYAKQAHMTANRKILCCGFFLCPSLTSWTIGRIQKDRG